MHQSNVTNFTFSKAIYSIKNRRITIGSHGIKCETKFSKFRIKFDSNGPLLRMWFHGFVEAKSEMQLDYFLDRTDMGYPLVPLDAFDGSPLQVSMGCQLPMDNATSAKWITDRIFEFSNMLDGNFQTALQCGVAMRSSD